MLPYVWWHIETLVLWHRSRKQSSTITFGDSNGLIWRKGSTDLQNTVKMWPLGRSEWEWKKWDLCWDGDEWLKANQDNDHKPASQNAWISLYLPAQVPCFPSIQQRSQCPNHCLMMFKFERLILFWCHAWMHVAWRMYRPLDLGPRTSASSTSSWQHFAAAQGCIFQH